MSKRKKRKGLGRGLDALLGDAGSIQKDEQAQTSEQSPASSTAEVQEVTEQETVGQEAVGPETAGPETVGDSESSKADDAVDSEAVDRTAPTETARVESEVVGASGAKGSKGTSETGVTNRSAKTNRPVKSGTGSTSSTVLSPIQPATQGFQRVPIRTIRPNPYQPRKHFDNSALEDLAASIRENGLIQPLLVRPDTENTSGHFILIAGERRWQASQRAGLSQVPVVIREASHQEMLALAIVENVQREDLDAIEAAIGYKQLIDEFDLTQAEVAKLVGKSRAAIANTVRLLALAPDVQNLVGAGHLSEGHARALLALPDKLQLQFAKQAIDERWSVRVTEGRVKEQLNAQRAGDQRTQGSPESESESAGPLDRMPARGKLDADSRAAVAAMEAALGTRVELHRSGSGGRVTLYFYSEEELNALYTRLTAGK